MPRYVSVLSGFQRLFGKHRSYHPATLVPRGRLAQFGAEGTFLKPVAAVSWMTMLQASL